MPMAELDDSWTEFNAHNPDSMTRDGFDYECHKAVWARGKARRNAALLTIQNAYTGDWPTLEGLIRNKPTTSEL